jgi:hypothetical protein
MASVESTVPDQLARDQAGQQRKLLVVDFGKRQSEKRVKQLRKGRGKLVGRVDQIVAELVEAGAIDRDAQPVVIVVREKATFAKFF